MEEWQRRRRRKKKIEGRTGAIMPTPLFSLYSIYLLSFGPPSRPVLKVKVSGPCAHPTEEVGTDGKLASGSLV